MHFLLPPTTLARVKTPRLSLLRTLVCSPPCRSALAPTFSSTGNTARIVSRLGPHRIFNMIMTGKPNKPLPSEFQVDLDEFLPGAVSAAGVVTSSMSSGEWNALEGLVDRLCITGLQISMVTMDKVQKDLVVVNPDDVFLSFVSNPEQCDSGNDLHLVTFSLPKLGQLKNMVKENKKLASETQENIKERIIAEKDKTKRKDIVTEMLKEYKAKVSSNNPITLFKENEILIGNFRFMRDSPTSQWTITEVAQINSLQAWSTIFKIRWKARLALSLKTEYYFYTLLRVDYMTDHLYISFLTAFLLYQVLMAGAPLS